MDQTVDLTAFREQYSYYARRLLADLGLSDLEEPLRGQLLASIEQYVSQALTNAILESLDDTAIKGINEHLEQGSTNEQVMIYLVSSIPGIEEKIAATLSQAYARMLAETREMTQAIMSNAVPPASEALQNPPAQETWSTPPPASPQP